LLIVASHNRQRLSVAVTYPHRDIHHSLKSRLAGGINKRPFGCCKSNHLTKPSLREIETGSIGEAKSRMGGKMKLSVEAKVAAAIAAAFVGLTMGAIARGDGAGQTDGSDRYGPVNNPEVNTHMNEQGYN
jgi:hypothetical protein